MKKPKIRIHVCVHLLLLITLGAYSSKFDVNPVTDDVSRLSILKHNIPKDYKIPVHYVPKEEGGMCWVKLNVFYLEESLQDLAHKFGNISSNRKDISIFIQILQELRLNMGSVEAVMYDFECHYREERWPTEQYFEFVSNFLASAQRRDDSDDCEPPPCPTTPHTPTEQYLEVLPSSSSNNSDCDTFSGCHTHQEKRLLPEIVERSLLSLLFIPFLALILLLVWKLRSRQKSRSLPQTSGEGVLFTGTEGSSSPLDSQITEKNRLKMIETV
ncbi:kit ligand a [Stigmatopora nigra]